MSVRSVVNYGRRLVSGTLLDSVYLQDRSKVRDTTGGVNETWTERAQPTRCRFVQLQDSDPEIRLESIYGRAEAVILFPLGTVYEEGDRARSTKDNSLWIIVSARTPPSDVITINRAGVRQL